MNRRRMGGKKELAAAEYLAGCGYRILERNFYSRRVRLTWWQRREGIWSLLR